MTVAPTLLSTFEVLFTPQLPKLSSGTSVQDPISQIAENVIKGYFLTVSNPNDKSYRFDVGFHCNTNPDPLPLERTLAKAIGFIDDGTAAKPANPKPSDGTNKDFSVPLTVGARGTVLLGILPAFLIGMSALAPPTIDCRGYVDITLPALFSTAGPFVDFKPQSPAPVPIIVTPEQRLTFIPAASGNPSLVEAQSAFALPVAGGSASLVVPPQPERPLFVGTGKGVAQLGPASAGFAELAEMMAAASPNEQFAVLSALVAASPAVSNGTRKAEDILRDLGFGVR